MDLDLVGLEEVPELDLRKVERIRARGRRTIQSPPAAVYGEASLVVLFSIATLLWAVSAVTHLA